MPVVMYLGLPGDGKSMSGVRRLESILATDKRCVVTNLPLEMGELSGYLQRKYGTDFDCASRVVILEQSQVRKFWLIRPDGWRLIDIAEGAYAQNVHPDLSKVYRWLPGPALDGASRLDLSTMDPVQVNLLVKSGAVEVGDCMGCVYIIDEAQNFWPARSYQTTPKGLLFYLSQHRHCGDDCVFITQKEGQVEKTIRNLVAEYYVFRDLGKRRRLGFRLPSVFGYTCFNDPPSGQGSQYVSFGTFRMDKSGLAQCYRTADGVGVGGPVQKGDVGQQRAGKSWVWAVVLVVALVGGLIAAPGVSARLLSKALLGDAKPQGGPVAVAVPVRQLNSIQAATVSIQPIQGVATHRRTAILPELVTSSRTNRWIVAYVETTGGSNLVVRLSDGSVFDDGEFDQVRRDRSGRIAAVRVRGEWLSLSH